MVFADFDYEQSPVIHVNFYEKPIDSEQFDHYLQELTALLKCVIGKKTKCCILFNCSEMAEKIPAGYITKKIQYLKQNRELIKEGLSASGIVGPDWLGKVLDFIFSLLIILLSSNYPPPARRNNFEPIII